MRAPSEAGFTRTVLELAARLGWRCLHLRPARTRRGWRTAVQGHGVGFPDLLCCRGDRIVAAELKMPGRRPTPAQALWLQALAAAGVEAYTWRPSDWTTITEVLA